MFASLRQQIIFRRQSILMISIKYKHKSSIDYSKFPKLEKKDIKEQFIQGHGPGGSCVNKSTNCVLLKHLPTGIVVKSHESRLLQENQKIAREKLLNKLDELYNGDMSITAQKKRLEKIKEIARDSKKEKLRLLKKQFIENNKLEK